MDLCEPCSPPASLSALLSDGPSLAVLLHAVTHLPLHSGLCVYALPASSVLLYGCLQRAALLSLWQRSASALSPGWRHAAATPQTHQQAGRRADGQADKTNQRADWGVFIASPPMHPRSKLHGQIRPEGKPLVNTLCFFPWHLQVHALQVQAFKCVSCWNELAAPGVEVLWSLLWATSFSPSHLVKRCARWNVHLPRLMNTLCYTSANNTVRMCA